MSKNSAARETATHWLWLVPPIVMADQLSKWLISEYLDLYSRIDLLSILALTRLHNTGAAFSFLADAGGWQRWLFTVIAIVISFVIVKWIRKLPAEETLTAASLGLILGGAIGNLIDRVYLGHVIDYIQVWLGSYPFPAFNIADASISVGAVLLVLSSFTGMRKATTE
jgi:signal peptidase II